MHGARVGEPNLLLRASALRGRRRTSVAQSCHAWCHDCHSRSSGDRCAPPSLALRAGRNPLVALRATRPNWDGAADMASEPRACVALLRVRSSAHPGPPPRLQAGGPPPLLALRAGCRLLIVALRDSTDSRTPRSRACARLSGQCAYTSRSTASSHGRRMPRCAHGCAPTREVSDSATRRASCLASARICYVLRSPHGAPPVRLPHAPGATRATSSARSRCVRLRLGAVIPNAKYAPRPAVARRAVCSGRAAARRGA